MADSLIRAKAGSQRMLPVTSRSHILLKVKKIVRRLLVRYSGDRKVSCYINSTRADQTYGMQASHVLAILAAVESGRVQPGLKILHSKLMSITKNLWTRW